MNNTSSSMKNILNYFDINSFDLNSMFINRRKNTILENDAISGSHHKAKKINNFKFKEIPREIQIIGVEFVCLYEKCMRKFKTRTELKEHYSSHMTTKLFHCEFSDCGKIYKSKENLVLHIKNIHFKVKPYRCRFCDASFSHRNGKTYHERKFHINYLPYKCNIGVCSASFASKSALNCHLNSQHLRYRKPMNEN